MFGMDVDTGIDEFFAAALQPDRWTEALERFSAMAQADGATLVFGPATPETVAGSPSMLAFIRDYFQQRQVDDSREWRVKPSWRQGFCTDHDFFTTVEIERDPFYQDFLKPVGYGWHGVVLLAEQPVPVVLSLKRSLRSGPFERRDVERLDRAVPYLRAAASAAAAAHGAQMRSHLAALAALGLGAITLDRQGRMLAANAAVCFGNGLSLVGGVPCADHRGDQPALEAAIAQALSPQLPSRLPPPRRLALRRRNGRWPLLVDVLPVLQAPALELGEAAALMVLSDLDRALPPDIGELRAIFGLTRKEAELAVELAGGTALDHAAEALRISRAHARQRLKVIFAKTDTHRQAELVALLARLRGLRRGG